MTPRSTISIRSGYGHDGYTENTVVAGVGVLLVNTLDVVTVSIYRISWPVWITRTGPGNDNSGRKWMEFRKMFCIVICSFLDSGVRRNDTAEHHDFPLDSIRSGTGQGSGRRNRRRCILRHVGPTEFPVIVIPHQCCNFRIRHACIPENPRRFSGVFRPRKPRQDFHLGLARSKR